MRMSEISVTFVALRLRVYWLYAGILPVRRADWAVNRRGWRWPSSALPGATRALYRFVEEGAASSRTRAGWRICTTTWRS